MGSQRGILFYSIQIFIQSATRNRILEISIEPTKTKSRKPVYSQVLIQNKIDRQSVKIRRVRKAGNQSDGYGGWCLELRREGRYREEEDRSSD